MSGEIYQLVYRSTYQYGRIDSALQALREIVSASTRNNANLRITGYLVFDGDTFLQILEGARWDILATFAKIETDPRHRDAVIVQSKLIEQRDFAAWAMGGILRTQPIPASLSGDEAIRFAKDLAFPGKSAAA